MCEQIELVEGQPATTDIELPQSVIESFARCLMPEIRKFYESEEGQRAFAEWEAEQEQAQTQVLPPAA